MRERILVDRCEAKMHELGLYTKSYIERLSREAKIIQNQEMVQYFLDCADHAKTKGKVKNTNHLLTSFLLGITDEDPIALKMELITTKYAEFPDIDKVLNVLTSTD